MMRNRPQAQQLEPSVSDLKHVLVGDTLLLLKVPGLRIDRGDVVTLLQKEHAKRESQSEELVDLEGMHICHGTEAPETYVYFSIADRAAEAGELEPARFQLMKDELGAVWRSAYAGSEVVALTVTRVVDGAAAAQSAGWHYVVETDVLTAAEQDFNDWYSEEHLPGLAAVPGCVRAIRLQQTAGSPRYHALYLLETRETFGSEAWLKVRATDWSSRVRPNFINTKRTMFEIEGEAHPRRVTD